MIVTFASTIISLSFAISVFRQYLRRNKIYQLIWSLGLLFFSISTLLEFISEVWNWNVLMYKMYYIVIAFLVAVLGLGTVYLLSDKRIGHIFAIYIIAMLIIMIGVISTAQVDTTKFIKGKIVAGSAMPSKVRILSPFFTIPGSISLIGGALYSFYRTKTNYNLFIGIGALIVASAGSLSRFGIEEVLYLLELLGIAVMYLGFIKSEEIIKKRKI